MRPVCHSEHREESVVVGRPVVSSPFATPYNVPSERHSSDKARADGSFDYLSVIEIGGANCY